MSLKSTLARIPFLGSAAVKLKRLLYPHSDAPSPAVKFRNSRAYWEERYAVGGNSGVGSYSKFAVFKADFLNLFIRDHSISSVIEFGCGDGNQLLLAEYPSYAGYDVSASAVLLCRGRFPNDHTKWFATMPEYDGRTSELALSLDVIYHLVEDDAFDTYMRTLFGAASRYVIVYSSDTEGNEGYAGTHVHHRKFTRWVEENLPQWKLLERIPNRYPYQGDYTQGSWSDFFVYGIRTPLP